MGQELLYTRIINALPIAELTTFKNTLQLYFITLKVQERNLDRLSSLGQPIKKIIAKYIGYNATRAIDEEANNLSPKLYIYINTYIILITNLWTKYSLVNGSIGSISNISQDKTLNPFIAILSILLIQFNEYIKPDFPSYLPSIIPIFPIYCPFNYKGASYSHIQFPLYLVYTIIVYKSQGLTLVKVILNLDQREYYLGLLYIAVSQVKALGGIVFEKAFDYNYFIGKESIIASIGRIG